MVAIKPDTRSLESMAVGKAGEWGSKPTPAKSKATRRRAAADAPKRRFATIDGERKEIRQPVAKVSRPYPSAPVSARPGGRVAAAVLRTPKRKPQEAAKAIASRVHKRQYIHPLPFEGPDPVRSFDRVMSKREQANRIPFMPEFQAEGQPFPRISRDKDGNAMPRVRTDNGMTKQLQGRGIGKEGKVGLDAYPKRQREAIEAERKAHLAAVLEADRLRGLVQAEEDARVDAKQALRAALGREREALARGDLDAATSARQSIQKYRKAARFK